MSSNRLFIISFCVILTAVPLLIISGLIGLVQNSLVWHIEFLNQIMPYTGFHVLHS